MLCFQTLALAHRVVGQAAWPDMCSVSFSFRSMSSGCMKKWNNKMWHSEMSRASRTSSIDPVPPATHSTRERYYYFIKQVSVWVCMHADTHLSQGMSVTYLRISGTDNMTEVGVIFKFYDENLPPYLLFMYSCYFTYLCIQLSLFSSPLNFISAWVCENVEY